MSERNSRGQERSSSREVSVRNSRGGERRPSREIREVREIREYRDGERSGRQVSRENIERREKKRVLVLGGTRIFFDEIQRYGIATKKEYYEKIYRGTFYGLPYYETGNSQKIDKDRYDDCKSNSTDSILIAYGSGNPRYEDFYLINRTMNPDEFVYFKKRRYLYVNTYEKNYIFFEDSVRFDIDQKCSEIDDWFNS